MERLTTRRGWRLGLKLRGRRRKGGLRPGGWKCRMRSGLILMGSSARGLCGAGEMGVMLGGSGWRIVGGSGCGWWGSGRVGA